MLYQFLLFSKMTQSYIYAYISSIMFYPKRLAPVPCVLFVHSKCNSLHLPTPNSLSIHFLPLPLGNHKSALYVLSLYVSLFCFVYRVICGEVFFLITQSSQPVTMNLERFGHSESLISNFALY